MSYTMSDAESKQFMDEMDKDCMRDCHWGTRPRHFQGLAVPLVSVSVPNKFINMTDQERSDYIRDRFFPQGFCCDGCGASLGKSLMHFEDDLAMVIYHPDGGFVVTDGKRQDYCTTCAKEAGVQIFRSAITNRDLFPDV